jgi:hypothetical protein
MSDIDFEPATFEGDISDLEDRLDLIQANYAPGVYRGGEAVRAGATPLPYGEQEAYDLAAIKEDILDTARRGVNVAPYIESRPLVALCEAAGADLPPDVKVDTQKMHYDFYVAEANFSIKLEPGLGVKSADFDLTLSDDITDATRGVRPVRVFPGRKDIDFFKIDVTGSVGIDTSINLTVPREATSILSFVDAAATAKAKLGIVIGPFEFTFRRAAVEVKGEGDPAVSWSYRLESELAGKNDFKSILVLKIAHEAMRVDAFAKLSVVPYKRSWWPFRKALPTLVRRRNIPIELAKASA